MDLRPFQRQFLRGALAPGVDTAALSLLRGNRGKRSNFRIDIGSILAPAGEPASIAVDDPIDWVYPRACGGTHK